MDKASMQIDDDATRANINLHVDCRFFFLVPSRLNCKY